MRRGELLLGCLGLAFPASSSRRGLGASARSSRQAPLAGVLSPWPGKLLLPGPCLLSLYTWSSLGPEGPWRLLVLPWQALPQGATTARAQVGVLRYPYFSTPTGAPRPGPHTVPSVVGPGPNSARARVAWVALLLNSVPVAPSPGGALLSRRRGGEACEVCVTWGGRARG